MRRTRLHAAIAMLLVAALVTAGCSDPRVTRWVKASQGSLTWSDCEDEAAGVLGVRPPRVVYTCATLRVPEDWHAANAGTAAYTGPMLDIALVRAHSTRQKDKPIGNLLTNPGGPGGSGVDYGMYLGATLPAEITQSFDIIGFDPRGVKRSSPVRCFDAETLDESTGFDPDPVSDADFQQLVAISKRLADGCTTKYGDDLPLFSTEQAARDIDAIRVALGEDKTSYLGYSYGTLLGAVYAELFPTKIRAMVLDGAVDPQQGLVAGSESQAKGFERAFADFATWCNSGANNCDIAPDALAAVRTALDTGRTQPVAVNGRKATAGWVFTALAAALYATFRWPTLATAIKNYNQGDARGVFKLADEYMERSPGGQYSNFFDANAAVNCSDDNSGVTVAQIRQLQGEWRTKYPLFGGPVAMGMLVCAEWNAKRDPYPTGPAAGSPPIVVVGTTGDPATPYEQTAKLADMLGTGVVLTWEGDGHTAYPRTRCIANAVDAYLLRLTAPKADTTCPAG